MESKRIEILTKAKEAVCGDRDHNYGDPEDNFIVIAKFWTSYLETPVTPEDVCAMMILFKVARQATGRGKEDNWVDIAGYAACGAEVERNNNCCGSNTTDEYPDDENYEW